MKKTLAVLLSGTLLLGAAMGFTACAPAEEEPPVAEGCQHLHHDPVTLICDDCGELVVHDYDENGVCTRCGKTTVFATSPIGGQAITQDCSEQGAIEKVTYQTHAYELEATQNRDDMVVTKAMNVYLPYGYTTSEQYNVLVLLHGSGETEDFWFAQGDYDSGNLTTYLRGYGTQQVLDNMMQQGLAEKTIVVTPTLYTTYEGEESGMGYFHLELMNDIMPYIINNYSTYAASDSEEDMIAARDHMAYAGLSAGSGLGFRCIWPNCMQYFAYIGNYSGAMTEEDLIKEVTDNFQAGGKYENYDIKYWYNGVGVLDTVAEGQDQTFYNFYQNIPGLQAGSDIANGDNCDFVWCDGTGHSYACWLTCLYNCMQVFFKA